MARTPPPPLDQASLRALAIRYVGRYATTRAKLLRYLSGKLRERGWGGAAPADPEALADECVARGYVDDAAFAGQRADALRRRGYGARRIDGALRAAGIAGALREEAADAGEAAALAAAIAFARRRRLGPFGLAKADPDVRRRQVAAMLRAGHALSIARSVLNGDANPDRDS